MKYFPSSKQHDITEKDKFWRENIDLGLHSHFVVFDKLMDSLASRLKWNLR